MTISHAVVAQQPSPQPPVSSIDIDDPLLFTMAASNKQFYILYVNSAALTEIPLDKESQEFHVEIRLDQMLVYATEAAEQGETLSWDEEVLLTGNTSSTISLSIVQNISKLTTEDPCVGYVDVVLGTLLAQCTDNESVTLEMTSAAVGAEQPIVGLIEVELCQDDNFDVAVKMESQGVSQLHRFECSGNLSHLENAFSYTAMAVELTDDSHPNRSDCLANLGVVQETRFEHLGDLSDLENAILNKHKAVDLMDDGNPDKPGCISNLGCSQQTRFEHFGDLSDLDNAILNMTMAVELTDDGHSDKPMCCSNLGIAQKAQFEQLGDMSNLKNAISNIEKAVQLTDDGHPDQPMYLSNLGIAQQTQFEHCGCLMDLESAISNIQKAVELTNDGHSDKPMYLSNLGSAQQTCFEYNGNISDLENAILNITMAVMLTDGGHPRKPHYLSNLGIAQQTHFDCFGDLSDLENAVSHKQKAVDLTDDVNPSKPGYLSNLGISLGTRFERLGDISDLEAAISHKQNALQLIDDKHPDWPMYLSNLGNSQQIHFEYSGNLSHLEDAISNIAKAVELTNDDHPSRPGRLMSLSGSQQARFKCLGEGSDLQHAISNMTMAAELTNDNHPNKLKCLSNLGAIQQTCFDHFGDLCYLENAISNIKKAVDLTDDAYPVKARYLSDLGSCYEHYYENFHQPADLVHCISCFKAAAQLKAGSPFSTFIAAKKWAEMSYLNGDLPSALDGYRTILKLLPGIAWLGLHKNHHQGLLLELKPETLACLAATCAIHLGFPEEAVELIDLGRSVFWQQASSLRCDSEELRQRDPELMKELESVGQQLDIQNFFDTVLIMGKYDVKHIREAARKEQHQLGKKWEELVERVRQLPQLEHFLKPIPFHQLCQASSKGQVIIINSSEYGVDALIFSSTGPIEHVSLSDIDLETLIELSNDIQQPVNLSPSQRQSHTTRYLKPALRTIWNDILIYIFEKIHIPLVNTTVLPKYRIWWYLTGPLTFMPIHAAGPGSGATDVSQLVISSYVTTLQSLFQAQKKYKPATQQKLLSISQPQTPGQTSLPQAMGEVNTVADMFHSSGLGEKDIVCLQGSKAMVNIVLEALDSCTWMHFACHGYQDQIQSLHSGFELHDGNLKLREIASRKLSNGKFAFLSACHAASGQKNLPGEAMHLAAGVQFAGIPSVIATMWAIRDEDAPKVADYTYQYLLRNGLQGLDPSEAAIALNHAILHLRKDPNITVDQWAPFLHFGI